MSKNDNNKIIYETSITFRSVFSTWKLVRKTCKNRKAIFKFEINQNTNVYNIYNILKENRYKPLPFRLFLIHEPKARLVMSQSVYDKIVNHFVTNFYLLPFLEKKLIDQNVATRKGKGSDYANKLVIDYINSIRIKNKNKEIYCLKIDISKYFYSINHDILLAQLEKEISDKKILNIIRTIISETNKPYINEYIKKYNKENKTDIPLYNYNTGLSIGAMTSQFLAIFYLNDLDHFIKENLRCKYYVRYMDDFLIFSTDKSFLKKAWLTIEQELKKLKLKMNPKSNLNKLNSGICFLGYSYKIKKGKLKVSYRQKTYKKINKRLNKLKKNDPIQYYKAYASYFGYLNKIKKYERDFQMKTIEKYEYYKEKYPNRLIFIKEVSFYKTFLNDAILVRNFFDYKWNGNSIAFGASPCSKVLDKLNQLDISYVLIVNNNDIQIVNNDDENYNLYLKLSIKRYNKFQAKEELRKLFEQVLEQKQNDYDGLKKIITNLLNENCNNEQ